MRIAVTGFVEVAEATKWAGEETVAPGAGDDMVTPAKAESAVHARTKKAVNKISRRAAIAGFKFKTHLSSLG